MNTEPSNDSVSRFIDFGDIRREMAEGQQMYPFTK